MPPGVGNSSSWTSPAAELKGKLERLQQNGNHIGVTNSPFFPKDLSEYLTHTTEYLDQRGQEIARRGKQRADDNARENKTEIDVNHSAPGFRKKRGGEIVVRSGQQAAEEKKAKRPFFTLGEKTMAWNPLYSALLDSAGNQAVFGIPTRAAWPDQNELKAEGEHRLSAFGERRFPLPRRDILSGEAVRADVEAGKSIDELVRLNGEKIPWFKREVIALDGLDRLDSAEKELCSINKTYNVSGPFSPARSRIPSGSNTPTNKQGPYGKPPRNTPTSGTGRGRSHSGGTDLHSSGGSNSVPGFNCFARKLPRADHSQYPSSHFDHSGQHVEMPAATRAWATPTHLGGNPKGNGGSGYLQFPGHATETRSPSADGHAHVASRAVSGTRSRTSHYKSNKGKENLIQRAQSTHGSRDYFGNSVQSGEESGCVDPDLYDGSGNSDQDLVDKVFGHVFEKEDLI
jgi:hypothetical protein